MCIQYHRLALSAVFVILSAAPNRILAIIGMEFKIIVLFFPGIALFFVMCDFLGQK